MQINNPPYIATQRLQWWTHSIGEFFHSGLARDAAEESLRQRADNLASDDDFQDDRWRSISRVDLLRERETSPAPTPLPTFSRVVIAVDSGMGKSTLLRRLCCEIARERPFVLPIRLEVADLPPLTESYIDDELILKALVGCLRRLRTADAGDSDRSRPDERFPDDDRPVLSWLRRERFKGRIVLLIDAVDQATEQSRINTLKYLLKMAEWSACQILLTGRPPAIAELYGQTKLFENPKCPWQLVRLLGFTPQEREQFIGSARWANLPYEVRHLLVTPRVCRYLRLIDDLDWQEIHSPSDIYFYALRGMVRAGLVSVNARVFLPAGYENWQRPKLVGKQIEEAKLTEPENYERDLVMCLLAATAFEMLCLPQPDGSKNLPNQISTEAYDDFAERVRQRVAHKHGWTDDGKFRLAFAELSKVNVALEALFFETNCNVAITKLQFRDATIKEWFAAYWCAKHGAEMDAQRIEHWIYLSDRPRKDQHTNPQYEWFWRYLCEMPVGGRSTKSWLSVIAPLYRPSDMGRSCEMMYWAWQTLTKYRDRENAEARMIVNDFLGEFPAILNDPNLDRAKIAAELVPDTLLGQLVTDARRLKAILPPTGAPAYVRCPPLDVEQAELAELKRRGEPTDYLRCHRFMRGTNADPGDRGGNVFSRLGSEDPRHEVWLTPFWLKATHVTRAEFALFDPTHEEPMKEVFTRLAPEESCPVVNVSWYQSWCLAVWCGCALPTEAQFEFGVRAGRDGERDLFPQGDTASSFQINCDGRDRFAAGGFGPFLNRTVSVRCRHPHKNKYGPSVGYANKYGPSVDYAPNGWGIWHPVGQAWVWCADWFYNHEFKRCHEAVKDPVGPESGDQRVLRGGAWSDLPTDCRSAVRGRGSPGNRGVDTGFRLVCVVCVRTP